MENLYVVGMTVVYYKMEGALNYEFGIPITVSPNRAERLNREKGKRDHVLPYN